MLSIGITGGIGSGKSVVCNIFKVLGIPVYDADTEAKNLYDTDEDLKQQIVDNFGVDMYDAGKFNRKKMADIVFHSPEKLSLLNSLVHPRVITHANTWFQKQNAAYAIKEAALLIESNSYKNCDKIILVTCPLETRIARIMKRDGTTYDEVMNRINNQLTDEERKKYCDFEIYNDEQHLLIPQVLKLHEMFSK